MRIDGTLGAEGYRTLWRATVIILGVAVEQTKVSDDGIIQPVDFAGFISSVLAEVAANAGGVERLTAGRPGLSPSLATAAGIPPRRECRRSSSLTCLLGRLLRRVAIARNEVPQPSGFLGVEFAVAPANDRTDGETAGLHRPDRVTSPGLGVISFPQRDH